jgi:DNA-binding transcriptional MerR regulator
LRGIGRMARETGLTVSALRFYDGAGVLVPAHVDPRSNYRWYSDDQVGTARLIARLRRVGLPLADICRVLEHRRAPAVVDGILGAHLTRLEDGLADARRELSAARALLDQESPMTATTTVRTTAAELAAALRAVRYAVGTDPDLPMLTGVLLDVADSSARLAATDRYRLAVSALAGAEVSGEVSVLLPVDLVDQVLAGVGDDGPATIRVDGDEVAFELSGRTVSGRRLDHDFPDYRRILHGSATHRVNVDAAALRAQLAAAPTRTVPTGPDGAGETATVLTLGDVEVGVNREFLLEALEGAGGQLVLELDGPISPLALHDPSRPGDVSMLMPIRLT